MKILLLGPENRNKNIFSALLDLGYDVRIYNNPVNLIMLDSWEIDFMISNGYAPIIDEQVISKYTHKIINIHPAYLPEGKGIYPNFWSFFEGYKSGVTIHYIDLGIDTGNIILRKEVKLGANETLRSSNDKLLKYAELLFIESAKQIVNCEIDAKEQSVEKNKSFYHSRAVSEDYVELLKDGWDTKVEVCEELGRDFFISSQLIERYVDEIT